MARPDRSRVRLLATTARLLRRQGYAATGLQQVIEESGASSGSLYHHFPGGKEELAAAAVRFAADLVSAELGRLLETGDALTAVRRWLDAQAAGLRRDPRDGCPIATVALEAVASSPTLRDVTSAAFQSWTAQLAAGLERDGHPPGSARTTALSVISAIEGALLIDRTRGDGSALAAVRDSLPTLIAAGKRPPV